jgi:molybdopterin-containing oxidoreductase family iron-sulfur binding subunit
MSDPQKNTDLAAVRSALWARLEGARGRDYWRSLDDLAATPEFQDLLEREFPRQAVGWSEDEDPVQGRRNFLKLMGASLALAGMTACTRQPNEHIMPYVRQPEDLIPGVRYSSPPRRRSTVWPTESSSKATRAGPPKWKATPSIPPTLGACDAYSQAAILQLYDPDRSQALSRNGEISSWGEYTGRPARCPGAAENQERRRHPHPHGNHHFAQHGGATAHHPATLPGRQVASVGTRRAAQRARLRDAGIRQPVNTYYDFTNANVVVSLDADFLASGAASLRYARQFAKRRRVNEHGDTMNRLYVVEPCPRLRAPRPIIASRCAPATSRIRLGAGRLAWHRAGSEDRRQSRYLQVVGPIARDLRMNTRRAAS